MFVAAGAAVIRTRGCVVVLAFRRKYYGSRAGGGEQIQTSVSAPRDCTNCYEDWQIQTSVSGISREITRSKYVFLVFSAIFGGCRFSGDTVLTAARAHADGGKVSNYS